MDGYEQGERKLIAERRLVALGDGYLRCYWCRELTGSWRNCPHCRPPAITLSYPPRHHRTIQIGPAWVGRTVAALMLRLFVQRRQERCCGYRWKHTHYKDYREGTYLAGTGEWYGQLARATDPNRDLNLLRHDF